MNTVVQNLVDRLRRRQVAGSFRVALETAKVHAIIVRGSRWTDAADLAASIAVKGALLQAAQPVELAATNITNRVIGLIREEERNLIADSGAASFNRDDLKNNVIDAIKEMTDEIENSVANISSQALEHIHSNEIIMTLGMDAAVERFLKEAAKLRKFQVIVAETAPSYSGQQMALSLSQSNIDVTLISDASIFAVMSRVNKVILGTHAVLANGGLVAPTGSNIIAAAAKHYATPVVVLTELYKLSQEYPFDVDAFGVPMSPDAIVGFAEIDADVVEGIDVVNPAYDFVVPDLVTLFITNM
ncbi:Translation initiation factor eIF-2B subunit beta [Physocladia obscura]|uniref:Translation initiation factor eIF2B subunit beta n=1 Tax=Physocladia obscura TaxID=109957 RepID=A0AAD5T6F9_9FUNG|nr:Translation initiation factor eIF-2B subunit beta [Physocladia obscura]